MGLEVEPPWVEPKVDLAVRQVGQEVVRPWVEPKVDQTEQQVGQTEPQVGLEVRQVGRQQEMVEVQVAPLVGHQILRVEGRMQVCLTVKLEGRVVVRPSEGRKEAQVDFEG